MFSYEIITKSNIKMTKKKIILYWTIVMLFMIFLGIVFLRFNMKIYYNSEGIMIDRTRMLTNVLKSEEENIISNNKIKIGDNTFSYKVININDRLTYKEIIMEISDYNETNVITSFKIEKKQRNMLEEIIKYWRGKT